MAKEEKKRGKKKNKFIRILLLLFVIWLFMPMDEEGYEETGSTITEQENEEQSSEKEEVKYTGDSRATVMIYMLGSDLESQNGCATMDIQEICSANLGDNVDVIIQTGGAKAWKNDWVSEDSVQRFSVENGELVLQDDVGLVSMVKPQTLADFIKWGTKNYKADRMGLIMWNHGGGSMVGFGSDENFEGQLDLSDMANALKKGGTHFDFVGFDACLMGTIETAYMLSPYADYMIASEELEPGTGWYYTGWLELLGKNPEIAMKQLGEKLVEDFVDGPDSFFWNDTTLSVVDLSKIPALYKQLCTYMAQGRTELVSNRGYNQISYARSMAKSYGEGQYEQIDIADYVKQANLSGSKEVLSALEDTIVYHNTNMSHTNGLAMYFPYDYPQYYQVMLNEFKDIGMQDASYQGFFNDFINILVYGQRRTTRAMSPMEKLTGYVEEETETDYTDTTWYEEEVAEQYFEGTELATLESGELELVEKGEDYVLQLTDEQWDTITYMDMCVYMDDGEGYVDLGTDNVYEFDEDGDLLVTFNYTWVALDEQIVPFYAIKEEERPDGSWYTYGYVPAQITRIEDGSKLDVNVILYWDEQHQDGYVKGYRLSSEEGELDVAERNIMELEKGDKLDFVCDYYTYDGDFEAEYYFGDTLTVEETPVVSYERLEKKPMDVCFYLKDIYRNEYWTETLTFYFE